MCTSGISGSKFVFVLFLFKTLQDNPPPGSYEVANSFKKSQDKRHGGIPRTKEAYKRNRAFISAADRFAAPCEETYKHPDRDNPGPGNGCSLALSEKFGCCPAELKPSFCYVLNMGSA